MRYLAALVLVTFALLSLPDANFSQGGQMEASRNVAGGGVSVPGWTGKIDAKEEAAGMTLNRVIAATANTAFPKFVICTSFPIR